jgi:hypothetical protein
VTFSAAFANAFLCAFLLDCALTVADGLTSALGATPLRGARDVIAGFVFWGALLLALVATFASRLPRLRLLLLAAGTWWVNLDAPPLGPLLPGPVRDVVLGLVQAALAAPALHWIRRESGGSAWLFRERFLPPARPGRRRALALALVAAPLVLALGAAGCAVYVAERATGGFVGFGAGGISFDERRYTQGDREVVLVGMSHIGRKGVYDALLHPADGTPTLVLAEGVTDVQGLLPSLWQDLDPLAEDLGLALQPNVEDMIGEAPGAQEALDELVEVEHADLDLSAFRPTTVEILRLVFRILAEPGDGEARAELEALLAQPDGPDAWRDFLDDVLEKRNAHVLERIDEALERRPRVVVPWGALHLPGIEAGLYERGFELASSEPRSFLPYRALIGLVARAGGAR